MFIVTLVVLGSCLPHVDYMLLLVRYTIGPFTVNSCLLLGLESLGVRGKVGMVDLKPLCLLQHLGRHICFVAMHIYMILKQQKRWLRNFFLIR